MNDEGASCERFLEAVLEGQRGRLMTRYIPGDVRRRIVCQDCSDDNNARATFDSGTGRVTLCRNRIRDVAALEDALCHEFVHVYDAVVKEPRLDLSNPDDLACSEIRAAFWVMDHKAHGNQWWLTSEYRGNAFECRTTPRGNTAFIESPLLLLRCTGNSVCMPDNGY